MKRWLDGIVALIADEKPSDLIQIANIKIPFSWTGYKVSYIPRFFTAEEIKGLDAELVSMLDWARSRAQVPFVITSGKRTPEQNDIAGGVKDSSHLEGYAVDIRCSDTHDRYRMIQALLLAGFKRVGIYDKHLHVDNDPDLPQEVAWTGFSH